MTWIFLKRRKKKQAKVNAEYESVLQDFNTAEKMYQQALKGGGEYGRQISPHEILWAIAKSKRRAFTEAYSGTGAGTKLPQLPKLPERPEDIQGYVNEADADAQPEFDSSERRDNKSVVRRRNIFGRR